MARRAFRHYARARSVLDKDKNFFYIHFLFYFFSVRFNTPCVLSVYIHSLLFFAAVYIIRIHLLYIYIYTSIVVVPTQFVNGIT